MGSSRSTFEAFLGLVEVKHISAWSLAYWDGVSDLEASSSYTRFYQISKTDGTVLDSLDMLSNVMQLYFKDDNGYTTTLGSYNRIIKSSKGIFLCNPDTDSIFLYCIPCAKMHQRIEELLNKTNNGISVQYILSSFSENLNATNKYLIAACQSEHNLWPLPKRKIAQIFSDWFEKGNALKDISVI